MVRRSLLPDSQRGFTLLEVLVALVILSLAAGLLSQAMMQVYGIERSLDAAAVRGASRALREHWVRDALEQAQPGSEDRADTLKGDARTLELTTLAPPLSGEPGARRLRFELQVDPTAQRTLLVMVAAPDPRLGLAATAAARTPLLAWDDPAVRFAFKDRAGQWHEQWPPAQRGRELLPAVIAVQTRSGADSLVAYNPTTPNPLPGRRLVEAL